ncbi:MAG: 2-C-methyl-D-erythritol 4-phosphate cytidylyltransferase [Aquificae bacterium]|nr:2-C-methyl-D-erythritol 4-phosphate cytidylyltransferase [Aquificota bacterium]
MKVVALLLAGGLGRRFGEKKQFIKLKGEPLFQHSINTVNRIDLIDRIILVLPEEDLERIKVFSFKPVEKVAGGKERQDSVYNGLKAVKEADVVVIHDTARPFATEKMFVEGIKNVKNGWDGSITGIPARDTVKEVENGTVVKTLDRDRLFIVQTPQTFSYKKLLDAHHKAREKGILGTDDSYLMEKAGYRITTNRGSPLNFKITTREDLILAECLIRKKLT